MPTATLNPIATAARFALVDATGHAYRGLSFASEKAARQYLERQAPGFRRMLSTAGYRVGPVESPIPAETPAGPPTGRKPEPKPEPADVCRLVLTIRGEDYRVRGIPAEAFGATARAYRLRKAGASEPIHVVETIHGAECDCPDFIFRRDGIDPAGCKHVRALRALGLVR